MPHEARTQTPQKLSYQAIIRDASSQLVTEQDVGIQISILQGSTSGTAVYTETQATTTNVNGLVSIEIGKGTTTEDFSSIDWSVDTYFIKTETDPEGGNNYSITAVSQLLSVPYALFADGAKKAESLGTEGVYATSTDTLFVVKDHEGNIVFAVYPDGAQIIVNASKKGKIGGFAVSGRTPGKENPSDYFNISGSTSAEIINPSEPRILWYPNKEAFMAGRVLV